MNHMKEKVGWAAEDDEQGWFSFFFLYIGKWQDTNKNYTMPNASFKMITSNSGGGEAKRLTPSPWILLAPLANQSIAALLSRWTQLISGHSPAAHQKLPDFHHKRSLSMVRMLLRPFDFLFVVDLLIFLGYLLKYWSYF